MNTRSLLLKLSKKFPKSLAKKYHDYVGLMCGKLKENTKKILLCLDFDEEVLEIALKEKPDLIITHHPFIYGTYAKALKKDPMKKALVDKILANDLVVYSLHTNFDEGKGGMNDALAEKLGLIDIKPLDFCPMGRIGNLVAPMNIFEFAKYAKECFGVDYGLLVNNGNEMITRVALVGGGGSRTYEAAIKENADIYISGDAPHHIRRSVIQHKFNYLDLPHEIEKIFMPRMKEILLEYDSTLNIIIVDHECLPKVI